MEFVSSVIWTEFSPINDSRSWSKREDGEVKRGLYLPLLCDF